MDEIAWCTFHGEITRSIRKSECPLICESVPAKTHLLRLLLTEMKRPKGEIDSIVLEQVRSAMGPIPHHAEGEFTRQSHGNVYDQVLDAIRKVEEDYPTEDIIDYVWAVGFEKGYDYPPDMFRSLGPGLDDKRP